MTAQLNTLLRLRQYEVDRCQSQLASALRLERTLQDRVLDLDRQRDQQREEITELTRQSQLNIEAFRLRQRHFQTLTEQRVEAQLELETATQIAQQQRAALVTADQQRQVIEKLQARRVHESR